MSATKNIYDITMTSFYPNTSENLNVAFLRRDFVEIQFSSAWMK